MRTYPQQLMLLGSGELGKEVAIAAKRLGCKVIACDSYAEAPAMQVADHSEVIDMKDHHQLKRIIYKYMPDLIVPEIEAISVETLNEFEIEGTTVIPNARATAITMNREKIRTLASKDLGIKTAKYGYASNKTELKDLAYEIGFPIFVKPLMSSSGKGQSLIHIESDLDKAWEIAIKGARGKSTEVIVEECIKFDLEITLLTIRQKNGETLFCPPIGHEQSGGDYQCSWQPASINQLQLKEAERIAKIITDNLGGVGLFGVEFFISNDEVIFSELSPRPHDTGLVTLASQNLNEFELHTRAILGLPIPKVINISPAASRVILAKETYSKVSYSGVDIGLREENTEVFIFGKPTSKKGRRMGVCIATARTVSEARQKADNSSSAIKVIDGSSKSVSQNSEFN